ncbi:RHS repeat domain-containing protein, partial [Streptomyces sp. NPDC052013]|uniref:RHS repeat domain-containing protein n=1 Tax=Streptomyces sp. NPDC052013 TaxID=3365679 RepID=UPI0037D7D69F
LKGRSHSTTTAPRVEEFHYNEFNYLTGWDLSTGGPKTTTDYTYDTIGNMLSEHSNAPTKPVHQDRLYGADNTNAAARHIGPHALGHIDATRSGGVENYSYDAKGRLIKNEQDDGTRDISDYTAFDLPKTVKDPTGKTTTFAYDAFGQRFKKTGPDGTTIYIGGLFEQRTDKNSKTSYIYHLPGIGQTVDNGTTISTEYTLTDTQGSTGLALDNQGNTTAAFHYDPYGAPINPDGTPDTTRAGTPNGTPPGNHTGGFQRNEHDDALRLINNNGRLYDPEAKILTTPDPVLTNHAYAYTNNNPTNFTDPSGYNPTCTYCLDPGTPSSGLGNDINAGIMGAGTLGTTGYGGYNAYNTLSTGGAQTASFGQINDAITNPNASLGASDNAAFTPIITNAQNIIDTVNNEIDDTRRGLDALLNEQIPLPYGGLDVNDPVWAAIDGEQPTTNVGAALTSIMLTESVFPIGEIILDGLIEEAAANWGPSFWKSLHADTRGSMMRPESLLQSALRSGAAEEIEGPMEVFVHGTNTKTAQAMIETQGGNLSANGGRYGGKFFVAVDRELASAFAERNAATLGGDPSIVGIAIPRNIASGLKSNRMLQVLPMESTSMGATRQWVFEPEAIETLKRHGFFFPAD